MGARARGWVLFVGSLVVGSALVAAPLSADPPARPVVERAWPAEWPMDPPPFTGEAWPSLPPPGPPLAPATRAAARVVQTLTRIQRAQRAFAYQHRTRVNERRGVYRWDCSGMVSWVIHRAAPRAGRAMGVERTSARGIYRMIERAPEGRARRGWEEIARIEDVRPGDVFAWRTPPGSPSPHTGHTGFAMEAPRTVPGLRDAFALRIADAVVGPHEADTRPPGTDGGLGFGTFVFLTDGQGRATHYGWHGTRTRGYMRTRVRFGRLHR